MAKASGMSSRYLKRSPDAVPFIDTQDAEI